MDPYLASILEAIEEAARDPVVPHLISVDELRAAGALDVPPSWRKSLGAEQQLDLFAGLNDDDPDPTSKDITDE